MEESGEEIVQLDLLDRKIIAALLDDARKPYVELADELGVSGGTIHVRMDKLKKSKVVRGSKLVVDYNRMGYQLLSYVGINLHNARDYRKVLERLLEIPNIVEAHYTTGQYNIFTKIRVRGIPHLHKFLLDLQAIKEIQSTQTIIVLENSLERDLKP